jgi:hypothetical protein
MNIVAHVDTNLMLPSDIPLLTPESIRSRIYGSKLVLVVEQCMITTQWGCKICLLLLYNKLTIGLKQQWAVRIVGAYVVINWAVMETLYFGVWCRPFNQYWAVPVANGKQIFKSLSYCFLTLCRPMLSRSSSPNHECSLQHYFRRYDAVHPSSSAYHFTTSPRQVSYEGTLLSAISNEL